MDSPSATTEPGGAAGGRANSAGNNQTRRDAKHEGHCMVVSVFHCEGSSGMPHRVHARREPVAVTDLFLHHSRIADAVVQGALLVVERGHDIADPKGEAADPLGKVAADRQSGRDLSAIRRDYA